MRTIIKFKHNSLISQYIMISVIVYIECATNCGSFTPNNPGQCNYFSTDTNYCCYLTQYYQDVYSSICYNIPISQYRNIIDQGQIQLGIATYTKIDCGIGVVGTSCGSNNPYAPIDCYQASIQNNFCCMYRYGDQTGCIWSGVTNKAYFTRNGINITCIINRFRLSYLMIILIYFLII